MPSSLAIPAFFIPSATKMRTCRSRFVKRFTSMSRLLYRMNWSDRAATSGI